MMIIAPNGLYLNTNSDFGNVINIASMIEFGGRFLQM
jgi:hypothetical protein